jgi:serine/threonine protein kinase
MEQAQAVAASPAAEESGAACVSCHSAVDGTRCSHCGAAQTAGGYRAIRVIAQTPHSRMYLAEDESGRRVALKELMFALVPGVEQIAAFEREAAVLRDLHHSQIPAFVRAFTEGSGVGTRLYLAQEFIQGESLQERVARQPLTEDEAWTLAEQALEVLHHLHTRDPRLIHRDVKPANLILRERGPMALVDFGAVRDLARELTHGSTLVGTFGYMPPEQLGGTVDATSDLYALGATLLHGISGIPPSELLVDGMELKFEHKLIGFFSGELRAFLKRLSAPRRADRFPSAEAALEALRARGQTVLRPDAVKRAQAAQKPKSRWVRTTLKVVGGIVGAALLVVGALVYPVYVKARGLSELMRLEAGHLERARHAPAFESGEQVVSSEGLDHHRNFINSPDEKGFIQMKLALSEHWAIPFPAGDVQRVAVDDPNVVEMLTRFRGLELFGKHPGRTRVVVWKTDGTRVGYSVTVQGAAQ